MPLISMALESHPKYVKKHDFLLVAHADCSLILIPREDASAVSSFGRDGLIINICVVLVVFASKVK